MLVRQVHSLGRSAVETRNGDRLARRGQTTGIGPAIPGRVLSLRSDCRFRRSNPAADRRAGTGVALVIPDAKHTARLAIQFLHNRVHILRRFLEVRAEENSFEIRSSLHAFHFSVRENGMLVNQNDKVGLGHS